MGWALRRGDACEGEAMGRALRRCKAYDGGAMDRAPAAHSSQSAILSARSVRYESKALVRQMLNSGSNQILYEVGR